MENFKYHIISKLLYSDDIIEASSLKIDGQSIIFLDKSNNVLCVFPCCSTAIVKIEKIRSKTESNIELL